MKKLYELEKDHYIAMAKIIDNEFIGNYHIVFSDMNQKSIWVTGYTYGGQCINCKVNFQFDMHENFIKGIYTLNEDLDTPGAMRRVHPPTLKRIIDYLKHNGFNPYRN